jgi:hypothetical protein
VKLSEEERLDRRERRHKRKLAHDVIHHGYRAVARRVHPDVGGNADDMRWLREVCDVLHAAVTRDPSGYRVDLFRKREPWERDPFTFRRWRTW